MPVDGGPTGGRREDCWVKVVAVPVGGGRARAGLEIDHSEPLGSRVAISRAAAAHRRIEQPQKARRVLAPRGGLAGCAIVLPRLAVAWARTRVSYGPQVVLL